MRRDAPCAGVDVGNEVCSGVTTDGVLEGASQAQHKGASALGLQTRFNPDSIHFDPVRTTHA